MATTAEQMRAHRGPVLLSGGFRPFFLLAAAWAAIAILLWLPIWEGHLTLPTAFAPLDWHVHELLWGYASAAVAGFLLTSIPNWTGRLPVVGRPLGLLVALWAIGRLAVFGSALIGPIAAAVLDLAFLTAFIALIGREIRAGKNWRNLKVVALVAVYAVGNAVFHVEAIRDGAAAYGTRIGIAALIGLVVVIGGRVVPSFTLNWLRTRPQGRMAAPFGPFDRAVAVATIPVLGLWIVRPEGAITGTALILAGLAHLARLARWAGWRTWVEKLVLILHLAYLFVALGFLLVGATLLGAPFPTSAALHAWTIGAVGLMTLSIMTRASLGHTGRALHATPAIVTIYAGGIIAVLARLAMGLGRAEFLFMHLAAVGWLVAFAGFVVVYLPILGRPRG